MYKTELFNKSVNMSGMKIHIVYCTSIARQIEEFFLYDSTENISKDLIVSNLILH